METIQERVMRERESKGLKTVLDNGFIHYAKDLESKEIFERKSINIGRKIVDSEKPEFSNTKTNRLIEQKEKPVENSAQKFLQEPQQLPEVHPGCAEDGVNPVSSHTF